MSFHDKDGTPIVTIVSIGAIGFTGTAIGLWLIKKRGALAKGLWNIGKRNQYSGVRLLIRLGDVANAEKAKAADRQSDRAAKAAKRQPLLDEIAMRSGGREIKVLAQGGCGWEFLSEKSLTLSLDSECLYLTDLDDIEEYAIPFNSIKDISIGGPGTVTRGGGAIGGGFGVQGFLIGAAAASLINLLTTHTSTRTLVRIATTGQELFLLVSCLDPDGMRRYLSPAYVLSSNESENFRQSLEVTPSTH